MHDVQVVQNDGGMLSAEPPPVARLKAERVQLALGGLPGWELSADEEAIERVFAFPNAESAYVFASFVLSFGYTTGHYPAVTLIGGLVVCRFTTLEAGGVTAKDLEMARRISLVD